MAETESQPDRIVPLEKRTHHAPRPGSGRTSRPRGRPRTRIPVAEDAGTPEKPGIVQAPEVYKSELDTVTEGLIGLYGTLGVFTMFVNPYDGTTIISNAENMAKSVIAACHPYPQAWKVLKIVVQGNVWTTLVLAHMGPALAIMANHKLVPASAVNAFRQASLPVEPMAGGQEQAGPYSYPGQVPPQMAQQEMDAQQQQELAQWLAQMAIQQGQQTAQQQAAMFAPSPVSFGNAGNNGAVGMDSVGGLGDVDTANQRAAFTSQQINKIREESLRKTAESQRTGQTNGL